MTNKTNPSVLNGRQAYVVLGASGRIGKAVTKHLLAEGYIVLSVDLNTDPLYQLHLSLDPSLQANLHILQYNLFDQDQLAAFFADMASRQFHVYGFCNSIISDKSWNRKQFEELSYDDIRTGILSEIPSQIILNRAVCDYLSSNGGGSLVLISSIQGCFAPKFNHYANTSMTSPLDYSIAKASSIISAKWLSKFYRGNNLSVNTVCPGGILDNQPSQFLERYRKDCSNKGMLNPSDIAPTIAHLLHPSSRYITGQNIIIDDGWSL